MSPHKKLAAVVAVFAICMVSCNKTREAEVEPTPDVVEAQIEEEEAMFNALRRDHPAISRIERTGSATPLNNLKLVCPCCKEILVQNEKVFKLDGVVIGCEYCVTEALAGDEL